ncbi:hypothetical protein EUGRSUZ_I02079 [Eucalyptus grandis]|uniref:Uncharacterized protein n=2 Tax=Eucalyptus grandis TaxID=71139 RepID=A0ACC3JHN9_EUCGR|nr:hypothetical protein EUGRSUZ_I02079 [Eucalyptus grandis]
MQVSRNEKEAHLTQHKKHKHKQEGNIMKMYKTSMTNTCKDMLTELGALLQQLKNTNIGRLEEGITI